MDITDWAHTACVLGADNQVHKQQKVRPLDACNQCHMSMEVQYLMAPFLPSLLIAESMIDCVGNASNIIGLNIKSLHSSLA